LFCSRACEISCSAFEFLRSTSVFCVNFVNVLQQSVIAIGLFASLLEQAILLMKIVFSLEYGDLIEIDFYSNLGQFMQNKCLFAARLEL